MTHNSKYMNCSSLYTQRLCSEEHRNLPSPWISPSLWVSKMLFCSCFLRSTSSVIYLYIVTEKIEKSCTWSVVQNTLSLKIKKYTTLCLSFKLASLWNMLWSKLNGVKPETAKKKKPNKKKQTLQSQGDFLERCILIKYLNKLVRLV